MVVKRSDVSSLLVPVTVVVIGHDVYVVEVLVEHRHIITLIDDLFAWGNSGTQQQAFRLEGRAQLFHQGREAILVRLGSLLAVNLVMVKLLV